MIEVFLSVYRLFLVPNDLELVCRFVLGDYKLRKTWTFSTRHDSWHMSGQTHNPFDELPTYLHSCDIFIKRFLYIWRDSLRLSMLWHPNSYQESKMDNTKPKRSWWCKGKLLEASPEGKGQEKNQQRVMMMATWGGFFVVQAHVGSFSLNPYVVEFFCNVQGGQMGWKTMGNEKKVERGLGSTWVLGHPFC